MRLVISPPDNHSGPISSSYITSAQEILKLAGFIVGGWAWAGDGKETGLIVLGARQDASRAIATLENVGIRASLE